MNSPSNFSQIVMENLERSSVRECRFINRRNCWKTGWEIDLQWNPGFSNIWFKKSETAGSTVYLFPSLFGKVQSKRTQKLIFLFAFLESLSNSVFEDPKQGESKSFEAVSGADSVSLPEPRQTEGLNLSRTEDNVTEESKDIAMEVSSVETPIELTSETFGSQSDQPSAEVPMEVDLSVPSSGFTSAEQTPDSSQAASVLSTNESEVLETGQPIENLEKEKLEIFGQDFKLKEEMGSSEDTKPSSLSSDLVDDRVSVETCKSEEGLKETSLEFDELAAQETVLYLEKPLKEDQEAEKLGSPQLDKNSAQEKEEEGTKSSADVEDTKIETEKISAANENLENDTKPEKMDADEDVDMVEASKVVSPTTLSDPVTSSPNTVVDATQGGIGVESKRAPLTAEQQAKKKELMDRCNHALEYCLRRFPQHHKSRYRLAYVYYYSPEHKVTKPPLCDVTLD